MGWICANCSTSNFDEDTSCIVCGIKKNESSRIERSRITPEERRNNIGNLIYNKIYKIMIFSFIIIISLLCLALIATLIINKSIVLNAFNNNYKMLIDNLLFNVNNIGHSYLNVNFNMNLLNIKNKFLSRLDCINNCYKYIKINIQYLFNIELEFPFIGILFDKINFHFIIFKDAFNCIIDKVDVKIELVKTLVDSFYNNVNGNITKVKTFINNTINVIKKNFNISIEFIKSILKI